MPSHPEYVSLWLPVPLRQNFTYWVPDDWEKRPQVGSLVWAPLGRRKVVGLVEAVGVTPPPYIRTIKELLEPLPEDFKISPHLLKLLRWAIEHYLAVPGEAMRTFLPGLLFRGQNSRGEKARHRKNVQHFVEAPILQLTKEQEEVLRQARESKGFSPMLLHGITGSGKTEIYLQLCADALKQGLGILVLVPEIALTPQTIGRFAARFGDQVGSYHSAMTDAQRLEIWFAAQEGRKKIIVGTRSAICLPVQDLGLVIVDEEHDSSYKQEERFRYHGRDLAVVRAKLEGLPIILGSATPSLESMENARSGKYRLLRLEQRATQSALPEIHLVDLRSNPPHSETLLSPILAERLKTCMERNEQALLFLNRRGYAPFLLCRDCGEVPKCPNCDISLTYHRQPISLKCHYCEFDIKPPSQCETCSGIDVEPIGSGTEKIEEALQREFPKMRIGRLDRDVVTSRTKTEEVLSQFGKGELDVLVGTQLVTKGHDFKRLSLVGILLADVTLNLPDFRAAERLFQLVTQVAGRAGRHGLKGEVFLQTFRPEHYAVQSSLQQQSEHFFEQEIGFRKASGYPPFSRLLLFRLSGNHAAKVEAASQKFGEQLREVLGEAIGWELLGPSKALLEKLRGKFRWQLLLKTSRYPSLRKRLGESIPQLEAELPAGVQLHLDVDPVGSL